MRDRIRTAAFGFASRSSVCRSADSPRSSGLDREVQVEDFREGGLNDYTHKLATVTKYQNLTLKRGIADSRAVAVASGRDQRKDRAAADQPWCCIDESGADTWRWVFEKAYPVKWSGSVAQRCDERGVRRKRRIRAQRGQTRMTDGRERRVASRTVPLWKRILERRRDARDAVRPRSARVSPDRWCEHPARAARPARDPARLAVISTLFTSTFVAGRGCRRRAFTRSCGSQAALPSLAPPRSAPRSRAFSSAGRRTCLRLPSLAQRREPQTSRSPHTLQAPRPSPSRGATQVVPPSPLRQPS